MLYSPFVKAVSHTLGKYCVRLSNAFYNLQNMQSSKQDLLSVSQKLVKDLQITVRGAIVRYEVPGVDNWHVEVVDDLHCFSRANPLFCSYVAAMKGQEVVACAILMPLLKEVFFAEKGKGGFIEDVSGTISRMRVSKVTALQKAAVCGNLYIDKLCSDVKQVFLGAKLYNLLLLAGGKADICVLKNEQDPVLLATGDLLLRECGGKSCFSDEMYWATNGGQLHDEASVLLRP